MIVSLSVERLTIIFVPHERAKFRKIRVALPLLWLFITGFVLVFAASIYLTFQFFHAKVHQTAMRQLQTKNLELTEKIAYYEDHLSHIERQMKAIERKTQSLALMSDFETGGSSEGVGGIGGLEARPVERGDGIILWQNRLLKSLDKMADLQVENAKLLATTPTIAPVQGVPTTGFGMRTDPFTGKPEFHTALDISTARGEEVVAPGDGLVVSVGYDGGYGNVVKVSHGRGMVTLFAHLSRTSVLVGQKVRRGETLGFVGSTGRSTGPHLHYEVQLNGKPVDPAAYILDSL